MFVDRIEPSPGLLLFGGQEDVNLVASLADQTGFRVIATARGARADPDQFPSADDVTAIQPTDLAEQVAVPERTYAVLMSHNLVDDRLALDVLLNTDVPYMGVMGPRQRFRELWGILTSTGATSIASRRWSDSTLELTAIGFSVVSEMLAVHNGRSAGDSSIGRKQFTIDLMCDAVSVSVARNRR